MSRHRRYLTFAGQFESSVLGTFRLIRGFANLQDLAEISVPYEMEDRGISGVRGQQRRLDPEHAEHVKRYLESGEQRFLPEVILSIRTELEEEVDRTRKPIGVRSKEINTGIDIGRAWKSQNILVHRVKIDRRRLGELHAQKLIRRVDGNHRLALAGTLKEEPSLLTKYLAPFCFVLLGPVGDEADDYSESLIFHTVNSTALPLESEHALKLILGQPASYDMTPEREFAFSPDLHFTRLLRDGLMKLSDPAQTRLGNRPLTSLRAAVRGLMEMDPSVAKDLPGMRTYASDLLAALDDIVTRLEPSQPALCNSALFIELAARVWKEAPATEDHRTRVNMAVATLGEIAGWLGSEGLVDLKEGRSLSKQVLDIFAAVRTRVPKRVFLARWYPTVKDGEEAGKAKLRLRQIRLALKEIDKEEGAHLELIDLGTQSGSTFPIHAKMYDAMTSADIIIVDLTGVRPNVCVEAGFALRHHEKTLLSKIGNLRVAQPVTFPQNLA